MPLKDEGPASTSSGEDQGSDGESSSGRCDSVTSASDLDCSRESFTSDSSSKHCTPSCECAHETACYASDFSKCLRHLAFSLPLFFINTHTDTHTHTLLPPSLLCFSLHSHCSLSSSVGCFIITPRHLLVLPFSLTVVDFSTTAH